MNRAISKSCGECTLRDAIDSGRTGMSKANYHFRFSSEPALSLRGARLARIPTKRTSIWMMKPGCLLTAAATTGARGDGGEIFSNEKTGMVYPLLVELRHSRTSSDIVSERLAIQNRFRLSSAGLKD
jgi:hypothetical protein